MNLNSNESDIKNTMKKFNRRDLIILILPILVFALYLFTYNPGILTQDSFSLLHQIATGKFSNAYPVFYTFIVIFGLKVNASPITIGIFQILVFSLMWMIICKYHRKSNNINEFFIQFILTFIICLIPINAVYSIALASYALFGYCIMFLSFLIKVMIDKKGQFDSKIIVLMALTMAFISGLSPYGIFIAMISLISIVAYLILKNQNRNTIKVLAGLTILAVLLIGSLTLIYHVGGGDVPTSSDILAEDINLDNAKDNYFSSINETPKESFEDLSAVNLKNSKYDQIDSIVDLTRENVLLNSLFNNPITYLIFSLISLAFIYVTTKSKEIWLIYIPNLITIIVAAITSQVNLYANLLVFYLIAVILIELRFKKEEGIMEVPPEPQEEIIEDETTYDDLELELESITLDDINEILSETQEDYVLAEEPKTDLAENSRQDETSDLIDEILKEIEMEK